MNLFLKLIFGACLLALAFVANALVEEETLSLHLPGDTESSMTWPMLPGETLTSLSKKFYPNNRAAQRAFILKTQRLSADSLPNLKPTDRFKGPTALVVPNLKALSHGIKPIRKRLAIKKKALRLSYNIKSAVERIPESLYREYDQLFARNEFLKVEIEKLNKKLVFLQNKVGDLRLLFEKTLRSVVAGKKVKVAKPKPAPKKLKNLQKQDIKKAAPVKKQKMVHFWDSLNKPLWFSLSALALLLALVGYLYKKKKTKEAEDFGTYTYVSGDDKPVNATANEPEASTFSFDQDIAANTVVQESQDRGVLLEAKALAKSNKLDEAVSQVRFAIRAKPKVHISLWLYLLSLLKAQNEKDAFETTAADVGRMFNIMTPLWEPHPHATMEVPASLEEFPHILEKLYTLWPSKKAQDYLQHLIHDNRRGERNGFSREVVDEILLLTDLIEPPEEVLT